MMKKKTSNRREITRLKLICLALALKLALASIMFWNGSHSGVAGEMGFHQEQGSESVSFDP
jgi:hypothetical protein